MTQKIALMVGGAVTNIIIADEDFMQCIADQHDAYVVLADEVVCGIGWTWDGKTFTAPVVADLPVPAAAPALTKIKTVSLKLRMTQAERIAIRAAGDKNPVVFDFMDILASTTTVDLGSTELQADITALETIGLIAKGRAAQILTAPITPDERP